MRDAHAATIYCVGSSDCQCSLRRPCDSLITLNLRSLPDQPASANCFDLIWIPSTQSFAKHPQQSSVLHCCRHDACPAFRYHLQGREGAHHLQRTPSCRTAHSPPAHAYSKDGMSSHATYPLGDCSSLTPRDGDFFTIDALDALRPLTLRRFTSTRLGQPSSTCLQTN
jgi:hypothetical protein